MTTQALARDLAGIIGSQHVITDEGDAAGYGEEPTGRFGQVPGIVVRPGTTDELSRLLQLLFRQQPDYVLTPRGGGTSLCGGAVPVPNLLGNPTRIAVSLARMRQVRLAAGQVVAGAGVTLAELDASAQLLRKSFGVQIGAQSTAQVGGSVAIGTTAGDHAFRRRTMADQVVEDGIVAVLADGTIVRSSSDLPPELRGYPLRKLFAGTEGTLGFVTQATIRLWPRVAKRSVAILDVACPQGASPVTNAVKIAGILSNSAFIDVIELMMGDSLEFVCRAGGLPMPATNPQVKLLVEAAGQDDPSEELSLLIENLISMGLVTDASGPSQDETDRQRLWAYRKWYPLACNEHGPVLKLDVRIPHARYARFISGCRRLVANAYPRTRLVIFGHLAGGNVHINVLGAGDDAQAIELDVLMYARSMGGLIAHEHGYGAAKSALRWELLTGVQRQLEIRLKQLLDPQWSLNRGVRLPAALADIY